MIVDAIASVIAAVVARLIVAVVALRIVAVDVNSSKADCSPVVVVVIPVIRVVTRAVTPVATPVAVAGFFRAVCFHDLAAAIQVVVNQQLAVSQLRRVVAAKRPQVAVVEAEAACFLDYSAAVANVAHQTTVAAQHL